MKIAALALISLAACPLQADFSMPFEGRLAVVQGSDPNKRAEDNLRSVGSEVSLYLSPLLAWEDSSWYFNGAYDLDYSSVNQVLKVDEEIFNFTQRMNNVFELGAGWRGKGGRNKVSLKGFAELFNGKEATDDVWLKGQYDYRDRGARLTYTRTSRTGRPHQWNIGVKATDRLYPNYESLDAKKSRDKDQRIGKFFFDGDVTWNRSRNFSTFYSISVQSVEYVEAVTVDATGTTSAGTLRRDLVSNMSLDLPFDSESGKQHFNFGWALEARDSNLASYDTQANVFIPDYHDYAENELSMDWNSDFEGPWWVFKKPQFTFSLAARVRMYKERLAKDNQGQYLPVKQVDSTYQTKIGLNSPVTEHWSGDFSIDYLALRSNNADESSSLSNYNFVTVRLGAQFAY